MCVLKCSVWFLKKAGIVGDKLCWWPLNLSTLHNYTCIKIGKFIDPKSAWDITELLVHPSKPGQGGAPPHTDNQIRQAARGQGQVGLFKTTRKRRARSLLFWRSDSLEHGLNISETPRSCALQRAPVRWTLTLKTNHLWSLGPCQCRNTTEQRLQRRAFPVTSRSRGFPKEHEPTTWHPNKELNSRGKTKPKHPACFNNRQQV